LSADAFEEGRRGFGVGVGGAPIAGEVAAEGGGEDGLAEFFEEGGHGVEGFARAAAAGLEGFELGDDSALFGQWCHRTLKFAHVRNV